MFEDAIVRLLCETPFVTCAARNSAYEQATKVKAEADEAMYAAMMKDDFNLIEECIDTIIAVAQILKRYEPTVVHKVAMHVIEKNARRGYHDVSMPENSD